MGRSIFESPQTGLHRADMLLISPNTPHAHPAFGALAFLYLYPESAEWRYFPGREKRGLVHLPFNQRLRSVARYAAAGDAVAAQSLVDDLIGKSASKCPKQRCSGLSCRRAHQPESRRSDHIGGSGEGRAPISEPAGTPLQRSNRRAAAALCFVVPPARGGGCGDARSELDRSGSPCGIRGLGSSVANFPRNVRRRTVFAVQSWPRQCNVLRSRRDPPERTSFYQTNRMTTCGGREAPVIVLESNARNLPVKPSGPSRKLRRSTFCCLSLLWPCGRCLHLSDCNHN
jgi:hypothetical protein